MSKIVLRAALAAALLLASPALATAEVIKIGLSGPMSGAGASWGLLAEWAAKQAADEINKEGGVKVGGKTYTFEAVAYDNKYTASEGAKVGQALINKDGVRYVVFALGMAPVRALQALSEREGAVLFTTAAGKSIKGPKFPYTFTQLNSPFERFPALYSVVTKQHPNAKSVVIVEPNDATGQEAGEVAKTEWTKLGVKVADLNFYERGTTEFAPLVTRIVSMKPDIVDFNEMPPSEVGLVLAGLREQGWNGIKVWSAGTAAADLQKAAGDASNGVYMALAGDFNSDTATPIQRKLEAGAMKAFGEHLNAISVSAWDATMAIRAAMVKAGSADPAKVRDAFPNLVFESSYGPAAFGGADIYGTPQQMLLPIIVSQIQQGKVVEVARVVPPELARKIADSKSK
jgi:branched-chain amino acid transport system substrate-binding protein